MYQVVLEPGQEGSEVHLSNHLSSFLSNMIQLYSGP